jgi:hypothetical protein
MTDLRVQAQRLAGVGWRYTVPADGGRHVTVVVEDRGPRHLVLVDPRLDEALTTVRLPAERASVLAALLTGARFTVIPSDEPAGADAVEPVEGGGTGPLHGGRCALRGARRHVGAGGERR